MCSYLYSNYLLIPNHVFIYSYYVAYYIILHEYKPVICSHEESFQSVKPKNKEKYSIISKDNIQKGLDLDLHIVICLNMLTTKTKLFTILLMLTARFATLSNANLIAPTLFLWEQE